MCMCVCVCIRICLCYSKALGKNRRGKRKKTTSNVNVAVECCVRVCIVLQTRKREWRETLKKTRRKWYTNKIRVCMRADKTTRKALGVSRK